MVEGRRETASGQEGGKLGSSALYGVLLLPGPAEERAAPPVELVPPGALGLQGAPRAQRLARGQVHTWEAVSEGTRSWASSWILPCSGPGLTSWIRMVAPLP